MVKNGKSKPCGECGKNWSMSHRHHGRYKCGECAGLTDCPVVPIGPYNIMTDAARVNRWHVGVAGEDGTRVLLTEDQVDQLKLMFNPSLPDDLVTVKGALCDATYIYGTYTCPRHARFDTSPPSGWEDVTYDCIGDLCVSVCRTPRSVAGSPDYKMGSDSKSQLLGWGGDFRKQ